MATLPFSADLASHSALAYYLHIGTDAIRVPRQSIERWSTQPGTVSYCFLRFLVLSQRRLDFSKIFSSNWDWHTRMCGTRGEDQTNFDGDKG